MSRKRVVLVCMVDSIHVARWIAQFEPSEVAFTLFPSTPNRRVHAMIKDMMAKNGNIRIVPFGGKLSIPLWGMDLIFSDYVRGLLLRKVIKREQPDFIHALELQHGGYIANRALEDSSIKTQFIATNYGSDIFWFQQFPKHLAKIKKLLARANRYSAECNRDVDLAKKYGFTGEVMPVFPNAGGFDSDTYLAAGTSHEPKKLILVKGYTGWAGRASVIIEALSLIKNQLHDFEILVYSSNISTRLSCFIKLKGLRVNVLGKGALTHTAMLAYLASARLHIAISKTDGLSTSALEAVLMGAPVLQSSSSCIDELFPRLRPYLVPANIDRQALSELIEAELGKGHKPQDMDSDLVEMRRSLSQRVVMEKARGFYAADGKNIVTGGAL
jgi:hypothetical protein